MKSPRTSHLIVWVTAPNLRVARRLIQLALEQRLVACGQLRSGVESHYWWRGRQEKSREVLLTFKTTARRVRALEKLILAEHPYDTPQFVVVRITGGNRRYLDWITAETAEPLASPT